MYLFRMTKENKILTSELEKIENVVLTGADEELPGELEVYHTISRFPERHDCALLAWRALKAAFKNA